MGEWKSLSVLFIWEIEKRVEIRVCSLCAYSPWSIQTQVICLVSNSSFPPPKQLSNWYQRQKKIHSILTLKTTYSTSLPSSIASGVSAECHLSCKVYHSYSEPVVRASFFIHNLRYFNVYYLPSNGRLRQIETSRRRHKP